MAPRVEPEASSSSTAVPLVLTRAVATAPPRARVGFVIALGAMAIAGGSVMVWRATRAAHKVPATVVTSTVPNNCTALQVETYLAQQPQLTAAERINCWAAAGKLERARVELMQLDGAQRQQAVAALFDLAHPIADAGDDRSAGPIMKLIIELWPENYMAMFHVGMAEFALGQDGDATEHLQRFLQMYQANDVWRARANQALQAIAAGTALEKREAHFCR